MNKGSTRIFLYLLIVSGIMVFSSVGFIAVLANLTSSPSIALDTTYYQVNDNGDLTIQVTGAMAGLSVTDCNFRVSIPESFEMDTLSDGSPIMQLVDNGSSQELIQNVGEFRAVFVLQTFNSTPLPRNYILEIDSSALQYSGFVTPHFLQEEPEPRLAGGGTGITASEPYISAFYAYDSYKGEAVHVKTWIRNPSTSFQILLSLHYKINAIDYNNWEDTQVCPLFP